MKPVPASNTTSSWLVVTAATPTLRQKACADHSPAQLVGQNARCRHWRCCVMQMLHRMPRQALRRSRLAAAGRGTLFLLHPADPSPHVNMWITAVAHVPARNSRRRERSVEGDRRRAAAGGKCLQRAAPRRSAAPLDAIYPRLTSLVVGDATRVCKRARGENSFRGTHGLGSK